MDRIFLLMRIVVNYESESYYLVLVTQIVVRGERGQVQVVETTETGGDDAIQQTGEFAVSEMNAVERLKVLAEVTFQRGTVADVRAVGVFEIAQFLNQGLFDFLFSH